MKNYIVQRYLFGNNMIDCNRKFSDFKNPKLLKVSKGYYHFICEDNCIFTCTLVEN